MHFFFCCVQIGHARLNILKDKDLPSQLICPLMLELRYGRATHRSQNANVVCALKKMRPPKIKKFGVYARCAGRCCCSGSHPKKKEKCCDVCMLSLPCHWLSSLSFQHARLEQRSWEDIAGGLLCSQDPCQVVSNRHTAAGTKILIYLTMLFSIWADHLDGQMSHWTWKY